VLWAAAAEDDPTERAPWAEMLRDRITLHPSGPTERPIDAASVLRTICETTGRRPLLIVLDDLHAANPRSFGLLPSLAARLPGTRLAILDRKSTRLNSSH